MARWMLAVLAGILAGCAAMDRPKPQLSESEPAEIPVSLPSETAPQQSAVRPSDNRAEVQRQDRMVSSAMLAEAMPPYAMQLSMITDEPLTPNGRVFDWQPSAVESLEDREPLANVPSIGATPMPGEPLASMGEPPLSGQDPPFRPRLWDRPVIHKLLADQKNFYRLQNLAWVGVGLGGAAILANTTLDQQFQNFYDRNIGVGDNDLNWGKEFGNGALVIPSLAGIWLVDHCFLALTEPGEYPCAQWLEDWSGRSFRGLLVGAAPLLTLQWMTGGGRPTDEDAASHWTGFENTHGISGHAFVGAVPWFTAASMTDSMVLKAGFYGFALFPGISRIHDNAHYLSQVALGWWIAWLSVHAVNETESQFSCWSLTPVVIDGHPGIGLMAQW